MKSLGNNEPQSLIEGVRLREWCFEITRLASLIGRAEYRLEQDRANAPSL